MTKDRSNQGRTGSVTSVLRTELHIKRIDLHMHFGKQTSVSGCMCIDGIIESWIATISATLVANAYPNRRRV